MRRTFLSSLVGVAVCLLASSYSLRSATANDRTIRVGTFRVDITPPLGSPLCGGWIKPLEGIDDPLLAKGIVIDDGGERYVLCALDWCEVRNSGHTKLREAIAKGAGTKPERVAVQCLHQHNAPIIDVDAQELVDAAGASLPLCDVGHFRSVLEQLSTAAHEACDHLQPVDELTTGEARVEQVAATRRVKTPDGKILVRFSSCTDPALRAMPEGTIDPMLKTISLLDKGKPVARLHFYATHPQSYYGDGRATSDFPGLAREALEKEEGVFQIYFTGCGGDVTAGKYNDGSKEARVQLTQRMLDGMRRSIAASKPQSLGAVSCKTQEVVLPARNDGTYATDAAKSMLMNTGAGPQARLNAAILLAYQARQSEPIVLQKFSIGPADIVHLPGEPFIAYQLFTQKLNPDRFVAVAGYGDGGPGYVCTKDAFTEGGYEPTASTVVPESQQKLEEALTKLMRQ